MNVIYKILAVLLVVAIILGFYISWRVEVGAARRTLVSFFNDLSSGDYDQATQLYAGSYDILISDNPENNPEDLATLWKNACQINGFQCLPIRAAALIKEQPKDEFIFNVEFIKPDGSQFILGPCCGQDVTNMSAQSLFEFHVIHGEDGNFRVMNMPVYVP